MRRWLDFGGWEVFDLDLFIYASCMLANDEQTHLYGYIDLMFTQHITVVLLDC